MLTPLTTPTVLSFAVGTAEILSKSYDSYQSKELRLAEIHADSTVKLATIQYKAEADRRSAAAQMASSFIQSRAEVRSIAIQTLGTCAQRLIEAGQYDHARKVCDTIENLADSESAISFSPLL